MDLRLNATRRSINLSVCLVFDLEAGRFKFLDENLLGAGVFHTCLLIICSKSQCKTHHNSPEVQSGFSKSIQTISKGFQKCFHILKGCKYSEKQIGFNSDRNLYDLY